MVKMALVEVGVDAIQEADVESEGKYGQREMGPMGNGGRIG